MNMTTEQKMREAFEARKIPHLNLKRSPDGSCYHYDVTAMAFRDFCDGFLSGQNNGWLPISTAPRDGTRIDLWTEGEFPGRFTECCWGEQNDRAWEVFGEQYCGERWWSDHGFPVETGDCTVTHWMPIPDAPTAKEGV